MADINMSRVSGTPLRSMSVSTGSPIGMSADDPAGGARIVVDTELNDTSQHPVQNKAITEFVTQSRALFARNIGDLEAEAQEYQDQMTGVQAALAAANVRALNGPNLIKTQEFWTNNGTEIKVYGDASRWRGSNRPFVRSIKKPTKYDYTEEPADKGDSCYREIDSVDPTTGEITYKDVWHVYKDEDEIRTSRTALAEAVTEEDGAEYPYALHFDVTVAESGYNNSEDLIFCDGIDQYTDDQQVVHPSTGIIDELTDGESYTMSCWVRVLSGDQARLVMKYGMSGSGYGVATEARGNEKFIDVTGSSWQRVHWTFVYHATLEGMTQYKRVAFGVCRKYTGAVELTGFRLVHGGLLGTNSLDALEARIADLESRVNNA